MFSIDVVFPRRLVCYPALMPYTPYYEDIISVYYKDGNVRVSVYKLGVATVIDRYLVEKYYLHNYWNKGVRPLDLCELFVNRVVVPRIYDMCPELRDVVLEFAVDIARDYADRIAEYLRNVLLESERLLLLL